MDQSGHGVLVSQLCEEGPLTKHFGQKLMNSEVKVKILANVADALVHLHKNKIVHGNVSASQVGLASDSQVKLTKCVSSSLIKNNPKNLS